MIFVFGFLMMTNLMIRLFRITTGTRARIEIGNGMIPGDSVTY